MSRPIRVFHLITTGVGQYPYIWSLAELSDRSRFETTVGTLTPPADLQRDLEARGVRTMSLGCVGRAGFGAAILRLASWLRRERIDIIQTHLVDASVVGLLAARLAGTRLVIMTGHHSAEVLMHGWRWRLVDTFLSRYGAKRIIAPSAAMKETFVSRVGVPAERIAVIPHGLDLSQWVESPVTRERIRRELGVIEMTVFGAVGRLFWIKSYPLLLRAFSAVAHKTHEAVLIIVGTGPDASALKAMAKDLGVEDRVLFLGHRADIRDVMSAMDILVHASLVESFGLVLAEAAAMGKPIVSTDVGIARELIQPGVNGFLVPPGDVEAMRLALEEALSAQEQLRTGAVNSMTVREFTADSMVAAHERQYLEWLDELSDAGNEVKDIGIAIQ